MTTSLDAVAGALAQASWQAGVLVVLVLAACRVFRQMPARWRGALWMVVLVRLLMPAVPPSPTSLLNLAGILSPSDATHSLSDDRTTAESRRVVTIAEPANVDVREDSVRPDRNQASTMPLAESADTPAPLSPADPAAAVHRWKLSRILMAVWAVGVLLLAVRSLAGIASLRALLRRCRHVDDPAILAIVDAGRAAMGVRGRVELLAADVSMTPALAGALRPRILVSEQTLETLDADELRWIVLHELAHVRRRDIAIGWLWWWARTLHWFNPLAWWAVARVRLEAELACDELVLRRTADAERTRYGSTLVRVAELLVDPRPVPGTIGAMVREPALSKRIKTILRGRRRSRLWATVAMVLAISLASVGLTGAVEKTPGQPDRLSSEADKDSAPTRQPEKGASATDDGAKVAEQPSKPVECIRFAWDILKTFDNFGPTFDQALGGGEQGLWEEVLESLRKDPQGPRMDIRNEFIIYLGTRATLVSDNFRATPSDGPPALLAIGIMPEEARDASINRLLLHPDGRVTLLLDAATPGGPVRRTTADNRRVLLAVKIKPGKSGMIAAGLKKFYEKDPTVRCNAIEGHDVWKADSRALDELVRIAPPDHGAERRQDHNKGSLWPAEPLWPKGAVTVAYDHLLSAASYDFLVDVLRQAKTPGPVQEALRPDAKDTETTKKKTPTRTMLIRVLGPDGQPVAGARVYANVCLAGTGHVLRPDLRSDPRGDASIAWPGKHELIRVWISKAGYVPLFAQWWPQYQADGDRVPGEFTFKLAKGTTIGGVVKDEDGQPIAGVKVEVSLSYPNQDNMKMELEERPCPGMWLASGDDGPCAARTTDENGRWTLDNVPGGDVHASGVKFDLSVSYHHPDYVDRSNYDQANQRYDATLQSMRDGTCSIVMRRGIMLTGRVTDPEGRPVAGAAMIWGYNTTSRSDNPKVRTNSQGVYRFPPKLIEPRKGRLTKPDGTPRAGGKITYYGEFGAQHAVADDRGYYEMLPPAVPVTAVAPGWTPQTKKVRLTAGVSPLDFQLKRGKTLRLRFVDPAGRPVPKVEVVLDDCRPVPVGSALHNSRHPDVVDTKIPNRSDGRGVYQWTWAPDQRKPLPFLFRKPGYRAERADLVPTGLEEHVVTMRPIVVLSGQVTDAATGEPIRAFRVRACETIDKPNLRDRMSLTHAARDGKYRYEFYESWPDVSLYIEADGYRPVQSSLFSTDKTPITFDAKLQKTAE